MVRRFSFDVDWDEYGGISGFVPSLHDCSATGNDLEDMLDKLEEEVRKRLLACGQSAEDEIELLGCDSTDILSWSSRRALPV